MPDEIGIDVERLLRERGWLRALARGLVGPGDVDDVVQESWLAALGAGSRPRTSLRAWWAGLARNAARATRGAQRREREPRAPLEAGESEAGELLARAELQERLIAEVRALREPYRSTVLLRYFEGLSFEEVAARAGVPGSTARTRLARALEDLRARLGRDGASWALLAELGRGGRAAPISVGITEVATMGVLAKVSVGGSAVAALALAAWWRASGDEVRTAERAQAPEAARVASSDGGASPAAEVAASAPTAFEGESREVAAEPRAPATDVAAPIHAASTPLELRLDAIADTFLTEEPDVAGLLAVAADLAYAAQLVPDSLVLDEDTGGATGRLQVGANLTGGFTLAARQCELELYSEGPGRLRRWFRLQYVPGGEPASHARVQVLSMPIKDASSANLGGTELIGWRVSVEPSGGASVRRTTTLVEDPLTWTHSPRSTRPDQGYLYKVSDSRDVEPRLMPWLAGTDAFDAWLERLRALRGR